MRGKVDLTRILDPIFNPTPVNDAMGEVFILSFFHQCWPSRGSSMPNPDGQTFDLPLAYNPPVFPSP